MAAAQAKASAPDAPLRTFRTLASFRLHSLARQSERMHERRYKQLFDLNLRECRIIGIVGGHGEPSFKLICEEADLDKAHVSRLLDRLVKRGLARRRAPDHDQRAIQVALTPRGAELHRELHEAAVRINSEWLATLTEPQLAAGSKLVDVLEARIREMSAVAQASAKRAAPRARAGVRHRR